MVKNLLGELKGLNLLSDMEETELLSTGVYALNRIASGKYNGGINIGGFVQFIGLASTAKTVFATSILAQAQKAGYHTVLIDAENSFSPDFSRIFGLDPENLYYAAPDSIEDCFSTMETTIKAIREKDPKTPIIITYDSLAVSPCKKELTAENFDSDNMIGALRAKVTGAALRKLLPLLKKNRVTVVIINQYRSKVGVVYGNPNTPASGGLSLEYYLSLNFETVSNKTSDVVSEDIGATGINGKIRNKKNKVSVPYMECEFELRFDKGLNPYAGLLPLLKHDGLITQGGAWYTVVNPGATKECKFQKKDFEELLLGDEPGFAPIRKALFGQDEKKSS